MFSEFFANIFEGDLKEVLHLQGDKMGFPQKEHIIKTPGHEPSLA